MAAPAKKKKDSPERAKPRAPSPDEQIKAKSAKARIAARPPRLETSMETTSSGKIVNITPGHADGLGWLDCLQDAFGSRGPYFPSRELHRLAEFSRTSDNKVDDTRLNALLAVVDGSKPANEIEAMLASQIAVTHGLAMDLLLRAKCADQIPQFEAAGGMAARLLKAFAGHVELLTRLKRGNQQTVRVEHVHVHPGAQAIVGQVMTGGGGASERGNQPHAPDEQSASTPRSITAQERAEMPCEDPRRQPLPMSRSPRSEPLPHARRRAG